MNVFKITHKTTMEEGFQTRYTIVPAQTKEDAVKRIKPHLVVCVDDLGKQKEDIYGEWWDIWNQKKLDEVKERRENIREIKSPSHKITK